MKCPRCKKTKLFPDESLNCHSIRDYHVAICHACSHDEIMIHYGLFNIGPTEAAFILYLDELQRSKTG